MGDRLGTLKSKFDRILNWWEDKTPAQKWDAILQLGIVPGHLIGVHFFCDLLIYWYTGSCALMIGMFYALNIYTIQYYMRRGAFVRGMESTFLVGVVVGVCESTPGFPLKRKHADLHIFCFNSFSEYVRLLGGCWSASFQIQCCRKVLRQLFLRS